MNDFYVFWFYRKKKISYLPTPKNIEMFPETRHLFGPIKKVSNIVTYFLIHAIFFSIRVFLTVISITCILLPQIKTV